MKLIFIVWLFVALSNSAFACDVCGCSMSGFSMGVLPNQNSQFVGLRYNYSSFASKINHSSNSYGFEFSFDNYHRVDLMSRINLTPKLKLNLVLPFLYNSMVDSSQTLTTSGIGDPNLVVYYQPFKESKKAALQSWYIGGGVKIPVGKYTQEGNGTLINPNFQLGTGSVDFIATSNFTYRKNKVGFYLESSYKINTKNKFDYRFGNQFNAATNFFYLLENKKITSLFFLGSYLESAATHVENSLRVFNTGGSVLLANSGIQLYVNRVRLGFLFQYPLLQKFKSDNLTTISSNPRFAIDLIFSLGKNK